MYTLGAPTAHVHVYGATSEFLRPRAVSMPSTAATTPVIWKAEPQTLRVRTGGNAYLLLPPDMRQSPDKAMYDVRFGGMRVFRVRGRLRLFARIVLGTPGSCAILVNPALTVADVEEGVCSPGSERGCVCRGNSAHILTRALPTSASSLQRRRHGPSGCRYPPLA